MMPYITYLEDTTAEMLTAVVMGTFAKLLGLVIVGRSHRGKFKQIGTVANLYIYPVKSCGAVDTSEADCTPVGLQAEGLSDRNWLVLDEFNHAISMDAESSLTLVTSSSVNNNLRLNAPGMPSLDLPTQLNLQKSSHVHHRMNGQIIPVVYCGKEAENWLTEYLKRPAKLVFSCSELGTRDVYSRQRRWENTARKGDVAVFAYLTSYMAVTTESLRYLNSQLSTPVSPVNFRPNIVIENSIPFDEDTWKEMRIGDVTLFHSVEPCLSFRCRPPYGTAPVFGLYVSNDIPGHIKVGDPVYVLKD